MSTLQAYQLLVSLALIGTVVQLVAKLAFHRRFGIISRTLAVAAQASSRSSSSSSS